MDLYRPNTSDQADERNGQEFPRWLSVLSSCILTSALSNLIIWLTAPLCAGQQISTSTTTLVSKINEKRNHAEVTIAVDPSNPKHLLACSMIQPVQPSIENSRDVAYVSFDGGTSWSASLEFGGELWASDPSCGFGQDGSAFYAGLVFDSVEGVYKGKTVLYGSTDWGKTWSLISTLPEGDREFLTTDPNGKRIYLTEEYVGSPLYFSESPVGKPGFPLLTYVSNDGGKSFQIPVVLQNPGDGEMAIFGPPGGILPDGTFATSFNAFPLRIDQIQGHKEASESPVGKVRILLYSDSHDQIKVYAVDDLYPCNVATSGTPLPSLAVDSSTGVFRGQIYVAWADSRSGRCEILFSSSADRGKTWSKPITVNDDQARAELNSGPDDFLPTLAVGPTGVIGVLWRDRRNDLDNLSWHPRFSASLDGGLTFLPSVAVADHGLNLHRDIALDLSVASQGGGNPPFRKGGVIRTKFGYEGHGITSGETMGLAADTAGVFDAMWIDNRTGIRQIWITRINVDRTTTNNFSEDSPSLEDVSNNVAILLSDVEFDRVNRTLNANIYLQNVSSVNLRTPLKLKILGLKSKIGIPQFVNPDSNQMNSGTVFDFSSLVSGVSLFPGQRSGGKRIAIRLDHVPSEIPTGDYDALSQIVSFDSIVLGVRDVITKRSVTK